MNFMIRFNPARSLVPALVTPVMSGLLHRAFKPEVSGGAASCQNIQPGEPFSRVQCLQKLSVLAQPTSDLFLTPSRPFPPFLNKALAVNLRCVLHA